MGTRTTGGAIISIGPYPATLDAIGFAAVAVEPIGEVTSIGTLGLVWNTATHNPLATEQVVEKKTSYNLQHPELALAIDDVNQGQIDAEAASLVHTMYTIKITRQGGDAIYLTAQVSSFTYSFDSDAFENGAIALLSQTLPLKIPAA